ncbi:MAG: hypothetical protein WD316_10975 [Phycisphaeraceae bacterium]
MKKRYLLRLRGSLSYRLLFLIAFTIAAFSLILLPLALIMFVENIEIVEARAVPGAVV